MKLYSITDEYINFLQKTYSRVFSNKEEKRKHTRKYLGTVIEMNDYKYYIPLSSPKDHDYIVIGDKKEIRKDSLIVMRIVKMNDAEAELKGTLQIGTMIPVPDSELILYDVNSETDSKYRDLILEEIAYIRKNSETIKKNAKILYGKKKAGSTEKIVQNCLDFIGAEKLCDNWIQEKSKN